MTGLDEALAEARRRLQAAGIEAPRREAALLLGLATGWSRTEQLAGGRRELSAGQSARLEELVARRVRREPFAYLAGSREFFGRPFLVGPGVLVPRPETETLIEAALRRWPDRGATLRILDLGVGSGCILLTLLAEYPEARGVGVDTSAVALDWTRKNAQALGVADRVGLVQGSWGEAVTGQFDLILSNPPYIDAGDLPGLAAELRFEPQDALSPGADGLQSYRAMTPDLLRLLAPGGTVLLEIGQGQAPPLLAWFAEHGLAGRSHADLAGIARCLELCRAADADVPHLY
ncbi:peptide chain release factor N(5)-glutamine methyltransferase [Geminicoccus harenae]|uniref:peptide chain release factor N(5)-glutamine methyltransferase n=2 Tax=Geminicoccus harenae TaxID=2498453 RepID=UPI001C952278|nr:peptide chain release factor N(5)-glutamine methyltransferase [Geminicoccus harenae]